MTRAWRRLKNQYDFIRKKEEKLSRIWSKVSNKNFMIQWFLSDKYPCACCFLVFQHFYTINCRKFMLHLVKFMELWIYLLIEYVIECYSHPILTEQLQYLSSGFKLTTPFCQFHFFVFPHGHSLFSYQACVHLPDLA